MFPFESGSNEPPLHKLFLEGSYIYNENPSMRQACEDCSFFLHFPKSLLDQDDKFFVSHSLSQRQQHILMGNPSLAADAEASVAVTKDASNAMANEQLPENESTKKSAQRQQHTLMGSPSLAADTEASIVAPKDASNALANEQVPENESTKNSAPRKRAGKKDRRSKICTARGPRIRRMRLSLPIARKFFDLQDMLGFDKASRTIEWLLNESKNAIEDLAKNLQQEKPGSSNGATRMSLSSENELVLGNDKRENDNGDLGSIAIGESSNMTKPRVIKERKLDKAPSNLVRRESRDKARERARERTREKMRNRGLFEKPKQSSDASPKTLEKIFGNSSPTALTAFTKEKELQPHFQFRHGETRMDSVHIGENYLGFNIAPTRSASYSQSIAALTEMDSKDALAGFSENWENDWLAMTVRSSVET